MSFDSLTGWPQACFRPTASLRQLTTPLTVNAYWRTRQEIVHATAELSTGSLATRMLPDLTSEYSLLYTLERKLSASINY